MRVATLSFYFKMIRSVKAKKQFNYFENEIKSLNETFIPDIVYNVVFDLDTRVAETLERIYESIKVQSAVNGFEVDLKTISLKEIASNKDKIKTALNELFTWQMNSEIEELLDTREFINSYKKYLDLNFISTEVRDGIEALNTKYNEAFKKIKLISLYTDFKAQD
jgi:hypothetical protein